MLQHTNFMHIWCDCDNRQLTAAHAKKNAMLKFNFYRRQRQYEVWRVEDNFCVLSVGNIFCSFQRWRNEFIWNEKIWKDYWSINSDLLLESIDSDSQFSEIEKLIE